MDNIIINKFQTPNDFNLVTIIDGLEIRYDDLKEICQGGPKIGYLYINDQPVAGYFGGPFLYQDGYLYIPSYIKSFWGWGFKLAKIGIIDRRVAFIGKAKGLFFLDKIEGNRIYFFEDVSKKRYSFYAI